MIDSSTLSQELNWQPRLPLEHEFRTNRGEVSLMLIWEIQVTEVDPGQAKGIPENQRTWTGGQRKSINEPSLWASMTSHAFMFFVPMAFLQNILIIYYTPCICKIFDPSKPVI